MSHMYDRRVSHAHVNPFYRVFVNRGLLLDSVKFYGFDMDYTIAGKSLPIRNKQCFICNIR